MSLWAIWWVWVVLAVLLGMIEVLLPVFVFLGFAAGALATGVLVALGLDLGLGGTLLLFALLSGAGYLGLRRALGRQGGRMRIIRRDINDD
ncbi:hypothetical protein ruthe_03329 [Rubellimicrobium thermophilum DSM 16684]|uniref:Membrane protein implicated in regulation of membrane protease activity n=1 Tax=Rubellimicrobium thermophilum DSM 16684 TaxID=1123069 RepID=S9RWJ1_9RHOB|nr:hypothetical protein [Rubellimicrobium thermophilum]EPX82400.1 hypothetical protein ruthe_03329 [Rubellimicrobium thermophilum DSM 16684]